MLRLWRVLSHVRRTYRHVLKPLFPKRPKKPSHPQGLGYVLAYTRKPAMQPPSLDMSSNMLFLGFRKQGLGPSAGVWKPSGRMELNNHGNYGSCNIAGKVRQETPESNSRFSTRTATGTLSISNSTGCNE